MDTTTLHLTELQDSSICANSTPYETAQDKCMDPTAAICFGHTQHNASLNCAVNDVQNEPHRVKEKLADSQCKNTGADEKAFAARMGLNDNKAGMEHLDKDRINKIIMDATKGSKFYENEKKKDAQVTRRIEGYMQQLKQASDAHLQACQEKAEVLLENLALERDLSRHIVHVDMDAFYAAVEMRDNPKLRDVPMAVGGEGMLSTSNYMARRFGVRAAMPGFIGRKLCPKLVIVPCNFPKYKAVSKVVRNVLELYDPNCQLMSLDEAYLDLTDHVMVRCTFSEDMRTFPEYSENMCRCEVIFNQCNTILPEGEVHSLSDCSVKTSSESASHVNDTGCAGSCRSVGKLSVSTSCERCMKPLNPNNVTFGFGVEEAVREMRHRIHLRTELTASAGIAVNCMLAKICSDRNKPDGQFLLPATTTAIMDFMADLPIRKVPGIGKVTEKILNALAVTDCGDIYRQRDRLCLLFSDSSFDYFLSIYLGLGSNVVCRNEDGPKSKSVERTFGLMSDPTELIGLCHDLCVELSHDLHKNSLRGRTVTLKIKLTNFELKTRAQSFKQATNDAEDIFIIARSLLLSEMKANGPAPLKLRLMGVRMSSFIDETGKQMKLTVVKQNEKTNVFDSDIEHVISKANSPKNCVDEGPSFFDMVIKERMAAAVTEQKSTSKPSSLDLVTDNKGQKGTKANRTHCTGISKYTTMHKDVWDDLSPEKPAKRSKFKQDKGKLTMYSTTREKDPITDQQYCANPSVGKDIQKLDSKKIFEMITGDSTANPWAPLPNPTKRKEYTPLLNTKGLHQQKVVATPTKEKPTNVPITKEKPVNSYFGCTKSVWEDYDDSDSILYLSQSGSGTWHSIGAEHRNKCQVRSERRKAPSKCKNKGNKRSADGILKVSTKKVQNKSAVPEVVVIDSD